MENTTLPQVDLAPPQADAAITTGPLATDDGTPTNKLAGGEATPAKPMAEQQPTVETNQFELEVKYNKEPKKLTREEAIEYAQKGLNYDKVLTKAQETEKKLQELENSELLKAARLLAQETGGSISEVGKRLLKQYDANRAKSENITPEAAQKLREKEEENYSLKTKAEILEQKVTEYETEHQAQDIWKQQVQEFQDKHPDVSLQELSKETEFSDLWATGIPLEKAYEFYSRKKDLERRLNEMSEQTKVAETNAANSEASTGALGTGGTQEKELTLEAIERMTPSELEKNHEKIARFYGWRK